MKKLSGAARITEIDAFSDSVIRIYNADSAVQADTYLKTVMAEIEQLSAELTTAIKQDQVLSTLDEADSVRDEALRSFGKLIEGYAVFPLESKKTAATLLSTIFAKYKKITSVSYAEESSLIESLLEDLNADNAKTAISELDGISDIIASIRTAQDAFYQANDEYVKATGSKSASATSIKKTLIVAINDKLITYLNAMSLAAADTFGSFVTNVETELNRANETVQRRKSSSTTTITETTTTTTTE